MDLTSSNKYNNYERYSIMKITEQDVNNIDIKPFRYVKRDGILKKSNCTFDIDFLVAHSYGWWQFVRPSKCGNWLIFNDYNYSKATCGHQNAVRRLLINLGLLDKIIYLNSENSADSPWFLSKIIGETLMTIEALETAINKPRSRAKTNERRRRDIADMKTTIEFLEYLKGDL